MKKSQRLLLVSLTAGWLSACMPAADPPASGSGGGGAPAAGTGGVAGGTGGGAGTGGASSGRAGTGGAGASSGRAGTGGAGASSGIAGTGGVSSTVDGGARDAGPSTRDASPDGALPLILNFDECAVCHGPDGAGTAAGPEIQHPVIDFSTWVVRNGRTHPMFPKPMPRFLPAQLSDAVLKEIFTFLSAPPKPTTGAALFKDYCQNCHGADAKGGVTMRDISAKTMADFTTNVRGGHHPGEFSKRRDFMPKWPATELSDADIGLIFKYVDAM